MTVEGDLSRDQVADRMGVKTGTVSSHRARGLRKLADILGPVMMSAGQLIEWARHTIDLLRHLF